MKIDLIVYDFDGVMTNNQVLVMQDGKEAVFCNRDDGWAIWKIKELDVPQIILSAEINPVVEARALKLSIPCISGCLTKKSWLIPFCEKEEYDLKNIVYVGNGLNDLEVMRAVGFSVCPADACCEVKEIADIITLSNGGEGVIREFYNILLEREWLIKK